ncbi:hypothetical protein JL721_7708 [Aureococcus anophagefferens]|nr:hypothetical protein JL721_7708 [Aureococcus anophagefferens]
MADDAVDAVLRAAPTRSLYDVLGVPEAATHDDLRKAYRRLVLKIHPDKCRSPRAAEAFLVVSSAYEVLADAAARRGYDAELRRRAPPAPDRKTRESEVSRLRRTVSAARARAARRAEEAAAAERDRAGRRARGRARALRAAADARAGRWPSKRRARRGAERDAPPRERGRGRAPRRRRDVARGGRGARGVAAPARVVGRVVAPPRGLAAPAVRGDAAAASMRDELRRYRSLWDDEEAAMRAEIAPSRPPRPRAAARARPSKRSHAAAAPPAPRSGAASTTASAGSAAASLPRYAAAALRWRQGGGGAPTGAVLVRDLATVELKERKGAPVLGLRTPERRLVLEFLEGGDVGPDAWVATLAHLAGGGS